MNNENLTNRISDLERQLSDERMKNMRLQAERDALAAQVAVLTKTLIEAKAVYEEFSLFVWNSFVLEITNSARVCNRRQTYEMLDEKFQSVIPDEYVAATPQQCLAKIRAEYGRNGFIAGATKWNACDAFGDFVPAEKIEKSANEYAESVRQGGE